MSSTRGRFPIQAWFDEWSCEPVIYGPASHRLVKLIEARPQTAWDFILDLVEAAPNEDTLGWIGAGPLEDLLGTHGEAFISAAEERVKEDPRFLLSLQNVWMRPENPLYERLAAATGGQPWG